MRKRIGTGLLAALCAGLLAGAAWAAPPGEVSSATFNLDIPSQSLNDALQSLALAESKDPPKEGKSDSSQDFRVGQVDHASTGSQAVEEKEEEKVNLEEIVVTETTHGISDGSSLLQTISHEQILETEYSNTIQLTQSLPSNSPGGVNVETGQVGVGNGHGTDNRGFASRLFQPRSPVVRAPSCATSIEFAV